MRGSACPRCARVPLCWKRGQATATRKDCRTSTSPVAEPARHRPRGNRRKTTTGKNTKLTLTTKMQFSMHFIILCPKAIQSCGFVSAPPGVAPRAVCTNPGRAVVPCVPFCARVPLCMGRREGDGDEEGLQNQLGNPTCSCKPYHRHAGKTIVAPLGTRVRVQWDN